MLILPCADIQPFHQFDGYVFRQNTIKLSKAKGFSTSDRVSQAVGEGWSGPQRGRDEAKVLH